MPVIVEFEGRSPRIAANAFIAPNAVLVGDVEIGENASVWFGAVLRADFAPIRVGPGCSIQDNVVAHGDAPGEGLVLEERVTVGHSAVLHGAFIGRECLIGMGAILLSGCRIGVGSFIAAGSVVREGSIIPPNTLAARNPAVSKKALDGRAADWVACAADEYLKLALKYRDHSRQLISP
jgi:carbonic anhydrase/acetyltransferase-like protein (isoleucine patch superfamily)